MTAYEYELYCLDALPEDEEGNRVYPELKGGSGEIGRSELSDEDIVSF